MDSSNILPTIVIIGGIEIGKSSILSSLWPISVDTVSSESKNSEYIVEDDIPGRGIMKFKVVELPSVIYSLSDKWMGNTTCTKLVSESDVILFVLSSSSLGYKLELDFINKMIASDLYNNQHIVVCLGKSDSLFYNEDHEYVDMNGISSLLKKQSSLYLQLEKTIHKDIFDIESIVPVSIYMDWNMSSLKEKLWEGIISKMNDLVFDPQLPTVVIAGKRGCGKSSTLNELWDLNLPTNKAVACTKYPMVIHVDGTHENKEYEFNIVDLPGIAESLNADMQYTSFYKKYIYKASLLICLTQADTRAYTQDELFYRSLMNNGILTDKTKLILGVNQIDLLFKSIENLNGIDLNSITTDHPLIQAKIEDFYGRVYSEIFNQKQCVSINDVCTFSAYKKWNLHALHNMIIDRIYNN